MQIKYTITEEEFVEAQKLYHSGRPLIHRISSRILMVLGFALAALGVFLLIWSRDQQPVGNPLSMVLVGVIFVFVTVLYPNLIAKRTFAKDGRLRQEFTVDFTDQGVEASSATSTGRNDWCNYVRFAESKNVFLSYLSARLFSIFPKRAFAPGEVEEVRQLLQRKLRAKIMI